MTEINVTMERAAAAEPSLAEIGGRLGQEMLGGTLLLVGGTLTLTLWLMPVGLPLALLGLALVSAPSS